jgi:hypothetical protein
MTATPVLLSVNVLLTAAGDGAAIPAPGPAAGWPGFRELCVTVAPFGNDRRSVLELADACDVPTRRSCRTGVCHTCTTLLLSGDITYSRTRWNHRPTARCSSAAPGLATTSSWTCRREAP